MSGHQFLIFGKWQPFKYGHIDYEITPTLPIVISAVDSHGGLGTEKEFRIEVIDQFRPIVRSQYPEAVDMHSAWLAGHVLDDGGDSGFMERGVIVSTYPEPGIDDPVQ